MRKCESCGKLYQESKDVFCPHCGAIAQTKCTHGSSFDSKRYDRGEDYKINNPQKKNTVYNPGAEPHAQRQKYTYNRFEDTFGDAGKYSDETPRVQMPDITTIFSKVKGGKKDPKLIGVIIVVCVIVFNSIFSMIGFNAMDSEPQGVMAEEEITDFYTLATYATIELVDTQREFKTFALDIDSIAFEDSLPESTQEQIFNGEITDRILEEDTFAEMLICTFSKEKVRIDQYNNALDECYYNSGDRIEGEFRYEFTQKFRYDEIVCITSPLNVYPDIGYIEVDLPFDAFSISEEGEVTYYNAFEKDGNMVFEECSNEQDAPGYLIVIFDGAAVDVTAIEDEE